jgi:hypothetical protein
VVVILDTLAEIGTTSPLGAAISTAQLCAQTFRRKAYATAAVLKSRRNLGCGRGGWLTAALVTSHRPVRCKALRPRLVLGRCQLLRPRSGPLDRAEDVRLGGALGQSSAVEVELGHSKQSQQKPNGGGENSSSAVEPGDGVEKLSSVLIEDLAGDDRAEATPLPGRDRGTGNVEAVAQRPGTRAHAAGLQNFAR